MGKKSFTSIQCMIWCYSLKGWKDKWKKGPLKYRTLIRFASSLWFVDVLLVLVGPKLYCYLWSNKCRVEGDNPPILVTFIAKPCLWLNTAPGNPGCEHRTGLISWTKIRKYICLSKSSVFSLQRRLTNWLISDFMLEKLAVGHLFMETSIWFLTFGQTKLTPWDSVGSYILKYM